MESYAIKEELEVCLPKQEDNGSSSGTSDPTGEQEPPSTTTISSGKSKIKEKKRLVSFDVFMNYVVRNEQEISVSQVFSEECFQEWISNRKRAPKEPEESFRKALVAHVSGKDDRKPFCPEVEVQILKRLRKSDPWPCFKNCLSGAKKIGERGLKKSSLGYHESQRREAESLQMRGPQLNLGGSYPYSRQPPPYMMHYGYPYYPVQQHNPHMQPLINPYMGYYPPMYQQPPTYYQPEERNFKRRKISQQNPIYFALQHTQGNMKSSSFCRILTQFYSQPELHELFNQLHNIFNQRIAREMDHMDSERTKREFLSPDLKTKFSLKSPIGNIIIDLFGNLCNSDIAGQEIIQNTVTRNIFSSFHCPIERAICLSDVFESLLNIGYCYARFVLRKVNSQVQQVLLLQMRLGKHRTISCKIQDITQDFSVLLTDLQLETLSPNVLTE